jgi:xanthine dehydrogenase YagR molybdenum-binding subunit
MPSKYDWPAAERRTVIGGRVSRIEGAAKVTGTARYAYDINRPGGLVAKLLVSPYAHARLTLLDTREAARAPGVRAVHILSPPGTEILWEGTEIAAVAADTEDLARDALRKIRVEYEILPHLVHDEDLSRTGNSARPAPEQATGDPGQAFTQAEVVHEGYYGLPTITHCCPEAHGQVMEWEGDKLTWWATTQSLSRLGPDLAKSLASETGLGHVAATDIHVLCEHMGGGFGSKFAPERWGLACALLARQTGRPVKLMLDRDQELLMAGARPSDYARVRVGARRDGTLLAWDSETWSTGGPSGGAVPPIPYVIEAIPNQRKRFLSVATNTGPARAWRAPNHPQACMITMCALEDLAAKLEMDPLDFFLKNVSLTPRPDIYRVELLKAAELMDWKAKWRPRSRLNNGPLKRGIGLSVHTWPGRGHDSDCRTIIHPDGGVQIQLASQDLGTGTRTVIGIVAAETLSLPVSAIQVQIGDSNYPRSGASGGSTTVGGVSASTRRSAVKALVRLFEAVAPSFGVPPDQLAAIDGRIQVGRDSSLSYSWKEACARLAKPIVEMGRNPARDEGDLIGSGVGGVQMAEVEVDTETGIIAVKKIVAVQDCGLIINLQTAESQVYGAITMAMAGALFEERIYDEHTGRMLNPDMEFNKMTGFGDTGEIVVHMMTSVYDSRGVIGLGEPPVVSPIAAICNATANAIGVRVPTVPMTPDKVLAALEEARRM